VKPIIFSTLVKDDVREVVRRATHLFLDFFDAFVGPLERRARHVKSSTHRRPRPRHADLAAYTARINATNFALANDDGTARDYAQGRRHPRRRLALRQDADLPVHGAAVRRVRGELSADRGRPRGEPAARGAGTVPRKLYGLTITPGAAAADPHRAAARQPLRLAAAGAVRGARRGGDVRALLGIPYIDTTECSIEEISSRILRPPASSAACGRERCTSRCVREAPLNAVLPRAPRASYSGSLSMSLATFIADSYARSSWRARPRSFVALMGLYESNYTRLGWLVDDIRALEGVSRSVRGRRL
jgi:[pyruvate, water dikinase]-phosphate phosphotransferase / [pyruvate, water dikinase] kinase